MQLTAELQEKITRLLSTEIEYADQLLETLEQENQALTGNDPEAIKQAVGLKQASLLQMSHQLQQRDQFLRQLSLPEGNQGTDILIGQLPGDHATTRLWSDLKQKARELKTQNEINGGIVTLGQRHAKRAMEILSGQHSSSHTYGPDGERRKAAATPPLGKA
jgi:flagella synthesis protein FlgN